MLPLTLFPFRPTDCRDGVLCAYWKRPHAYLDPKVRAGISCFPALPAEKVNNGLGALDHDLRSGAWERRNSDLLVLDQRDFGYRLIVATLSE